MSNQTSDNIKPATSGTARIRKNPSRDTGTNNKPRKSLRETISEIDQEILRLLLRRHNLLEKIRTHGRLDSADEKYLREAWQNDVARVSRDPQLSGRFFSLMQEIAFMPKPVQQENDDPLPGSMRRQVFNLAPPRQPAQIKLVGPVANELSEAWMYLACASGQPTKISNSAMSDPQVDFIKALAQAGGAISRSDGGIVVRGSMPLGTPDKVIHLGDSFLNFYIFLAHYLGKPSKAKFTGETSLKIADFSWLGNLLPKLGARLVHIVPKSCGFPVRVECSGILPDSLVYEPDWPAQFAIALILAAPFYEKPFALNLRKHPQRSALIEKIIPVLDKAGITYLIDEYTVNIDSGSISIPSSPDLPMDLAINSFILGFAQAMGGTVTLEGKWPHWPDCRLFTSLLAQMGINWEIDSTHVTSTQSKCITEFLLGSLPASSLPPPFPGMIPLLCSLAACVALNKGNASLPESFMDDTNVTDFLRLTGLEATPAGKLQIASERQANLANNVPDGYWAMAYAMAACCRPSRVGWPLGNPGIVTEVWPAFWAFYNSLPQPELSRQTSVAQTKTKSRRRIITSVVAVPPEIKEEDW